MFKTLTEFKQFINKTNLAKLKKIKTQCDNLYYNPKDETTSSFLTDEQYDLLIETIVQREKPTFVVPIGAKVNNSTEVELPFFLGSMNKMKTDDDINRWLKKYKNEHYIIEDKLDGVSCLLVLDNKSIQLFTRGDGKFGTDISHLSSHINGIPKLLCEHSITVRGELIIKKQTFDTKYSGKFANARNLVSGLVNSKTIKEETKDIDFVAYEILDRGENNGLPIEEQFDILERNNFNVVNHQIYRDINFEILTNCVLEYKQISSYEIDGIIVHYPHSYKRNTSGNPDYAFAFKVRMSDNISDTEVEFVEWNRTKWDVFKPRIKVKPVNICGVTINYATGFNAKYILENQIGPGSIVSITRSNDVIPFILQVKKKTVPEFPKEEYKWNDTKIDIIATGESSALSRIKRIASFFADLKIKNVSIATIERIFEAGYDNLLKILNASVSDFEKIDRFGTKLAEKIYKNIHDGMKNAEIADILGAWGIFGFGFGKRKIRKLFEVFPDILSFYKSLSYDELKEKILSVEGFADLSADKIVENLENAERFLNEISDFITLKKDDESNNESKSESDLSFLKNKKIVFSGIRDADIEKIIEKNGGKVTTSVSSNTNILVVKNIDEKSSKIEKAKKLRIEIISYDDFVEKTKKK